MNDGTIDEKEFINLFSANEAEANPRFKSRLKAEMLETFEPSFKLSSLFKLGFPQFALMSILVMAVVTVSGGLYTLNILKNNSSTAKTNTALLNDANKKDIFENVIKNNSISILEQKAQEAAVVAEVDSPKVVPVAPTTPPVILKPASEDVNYRHTKITTKPGPSSNVCSFYSYLPENLLISESYDYFGEGLNFNKVVTSDSEGTLTNYNLSKNSETNSEVLIYKGGEFAVKLAYDYSELEEQPVSFPESFTQGSEVQSQEDVLANKYFGTSAQINRTEKINNKEYYVIEDSSSIPCTVTLPSSFPVSFPVTQVQNKTIVSLYFVDSLTYTVDKTEVYLNSVLDKNLIYSTETQIENRFATQSEVDNTFNFEYTVPITEIKYDFTNQKVDSEEQVKQFVEKTGIKLVSFEGIQPNNINTIFSTQEYRYNWFTYLRNFYSKTEKGDEEYNAVISQLTKPVELLSYTISGDIGASLTVSVFEKSESAYAHNESGGRMGTYLAVNLDGETQDAWAYSQDKCTKNCDDNIYIDIGNYILRITGKEFLNIYEAQFVTL